MKIFASSNPDTTERRESSAGGVFTLLAKDVIRAGGCVFGASFDKRWNIVHTKVESIDELSALRGSKYAFSDFGASVREALEELRSGKKVLFCGTPCQAAAMRKMAGDDPNLLIVEVVCHGAPKSAHWQRYIAELCKSRKKRIDDISGINFRDKSTGWKNYSFTVTFSDGSRFSQPHDDNIYMRAFLSDLTLRDACFRCPFKYPEGSRADITLGDLWGINHLAPQIDNDLGTTMVIARTPQGEAFAASLREDAELTFDGVAKWNPAVVCSPRKPDRYNNFNENSKAEESTIRCMKRYAARPIKERIYLYLARLKHKLLN